MSLLFYEQSTKKLVSVTNENELKTSITVQEEPPAGIMSVHKADLFLAGTDIYVLDSITSGSRAGRKEGIYQQVLGPIFAVCDLPHTYVPTCSARSIADFAASLQNTGRPISLVVISGDTSICEFANSLSQGGGGELRVYVVPGGTGNSLALSIGIADPVQAVERILLHKPQDLRPLNLYEAEFPQGSKILAPDGSSREIDAPVAFLVVTSWGFHASLVADSDTDELRKFGLERFQIAARENLARKQVYSGNAVVTRGDEVLQKRAGPFAYYVVTSSRRFEPTFEISPQGDILDPNLFVVGFSAEDTEGYILEIMEKVYDKGRHIEDERVFYDKVAPGERVTLRIASDNNLETRRFCVDGAIVVTPTTEGIIAIQHRGSERNGWSLKVAS